MPQLSVQDLNILYSDMLTNKQVLALYKQDDGVSQVRKAMKKCVNDLEVLHPLSNNEKTWESCLKRLYDEERDKRKTISREPGRQKLMDFYDQLFQPPLSSGPNPSPTISHQQPSTSSRSAPGIDLGNIDVLSLLEENGRLLESVSLVKYIFMV